MSENQNSTAILSKSINLIDLCKEAIRRWYIIVASVLVCFLLFAYNSYFVATPMYSSNAMLYVTNKTTQNINSSEIAISTYLSRDFAEILSDKIVLDQVAEELDNKYSAAQIKGFLTVTAQEDTRIIKLSINSPNAKDSKKIADSICKISETKLVEILGLDRVKVVREGDLAKAPSSPNHTKDMLFGILVGVALSCGIIFVLYITNNKISSSDDVEKYLGLTVLATIPFNQRKQK